MRVIQDDAGREWTIFLVIPGSLAIRRTNTTVLPDTFRSGWLCFQCSEETRRLAPVPDVWESLPDGELRLLCAEATPGRQRTPGLAEG